MLLHRWSEQNASLNAFGLAVQQGTHGLFRDLTLDRIDDDCVVVRGSCRSYYGVQLAIHAAKQFGRDHSLPEIRLLVCVGGSTLELILVHAASRDACDAMSTPDVTRRRRLTDLASSSPKAAAGTAPTREIPRDFAGP